MLYQDDAACFASSPGCPCGNLSEPSTLLGTPCRTRYKLSSPLFGGWQTKFGLATYRPCQLLPSSSSGRRLRPEPVCEQATIDLHEGRHVQDHRLLRPALWREPLGCVGPTAGCEQHTAHEHRTHEREARLCVGISLSTIFAATASDMVDPPASSTVTSLPGRVSSDSV